MKRLGMPFTTPGSVTGEVGIRCLRLGVGLLGRFFGGSAAVSLYKMQQLLSRLCENLKSRELGLCDQSFVIFVVSL